jgi:hypothetical protein
MNHHSTDYGWTRGTSTQRGHVAEEYGWLQPSHPSVSEITCSECGRTFPAPESAGVCYCERCVNFACD